MECNSENTSDANGVHLQGNFLFSLSLLLETETFDRYIITFFYNWLKLHCNFVLHVSQRFQDVIIIYFYFLTARSRTVF